MSDNNWCSFFYTFSLELMTEYRKYMFLLPTRLSFHFSFFFSYSSLSTTSKRLKKVDWRSSCAPQLFCYFSTTLFEHNLVILFSSCIRQFSYHQEKLSNIIECLGDRMFSESKPRAINIFNRAVNNCTVLIVFVDAGVGMRFYLACTSTP